MDPEGNQTNSARPRVLLRTFPLNPADYDGERTYRLAWQIRGSTLTHFLDPVHSQPGPRAILYGLANGPHRLTLRAPANQRFKPLSSASTGFQAIRCGAHG